MNDQKTIEVLENLEVKKADADLIHLSTGVILRGKKVSASLLIEVLTSSRRPKPPTYFNRQMGRNMENVNDPDYSEQVQAYKYEQAGAVVTAMILMGTEIVSIPEGLEGPHPIPKIQSQRKKLQKKGTRIEKPPNQPEPDEIVEEWPKWLDDYALLNLPMNTGSAAWRYLTWVKFLAAPDDNDLKSIQEVVGRLSGIREQDVQAVEEFPGRNPPNR